MIEDKYMVPRQGYNDANSPHPTQQQVTEGRNSPEGSESHEVVEGSAMSSSLTDQVTEMDLLLTRFLKVCCVLKNESDLQLTETEDDK